MRAKRTICLIYILSEEQETAAHSSALAWENPMDRGAWWATVRRVTKSRTRLSDWAHILSEESALPGERDHKNQCFIEGHFGDTGISVSIFLMQNYRKKCLDIVIYNCASPEFTAPELVLE